MTLAILNSFGKTPVSNEQLIILASGLLRCSAHALTRLSEIRSGPLDFFLSNLPINFKISD